MNLVHVFNEILRLFTRPIVIFPIINIFLLFLSSVVILQKIKNKNLKTLFSIVLGLFMMFEISSLLIINKFLGYEFFLHFNYNDFSHMFSFYFEVLLLQVVFIIILFFLFQTFIRIIQKIISKIKKVKVINRITINAIRIAIISLSIIVMLSESDHGVKGILNKKVEALILLDSSTSGSFQSSLNTLGMNDYVNKDDISASNSGKNVIVISLESFETAFLNHPDTSITTYFRKLKRNWNYFEIHQNLGSNWTAGSLYTLMTGFPALFGSKHNSTFSNSFNSKLSSVPDIFEKLNYEKIFISDNADFAGTRAMLNVFGFDKIIDKNQLENKFDKDLFSAAKKEIIKHEKSQVNYFLLISTLDTHAPNGRYDDSFKELFPNLRGLEYSIAVLDYLINDFIMFLNEFGYLDNSVVNIIPDHLFMGEPRFITSGEKRSLFLLTNSLPRKKNENSKEKFYQVDLPKLILSSSGIIHNVKFFSDYHNGNLDSIINKNQIAMKSLNINGFNRNTDFKYPKNIKKIFNEDNSIFIAHAGGEINGDIYTNSLDALDYNYSLGAKYFELDLQVTSDNKIVAVHDWMEWAKLTNWEGEVPPSNNDFMSRNVFNKYIPLDIDAINKWFSIHRDAVLITDKINSPSRLSSEFMFKDRLLMEIFDIDTLYTSIELGVKAIVSQNVIIDILKQNKLKILNDLNYVAISHSYLLGNLPLFKSLKSKSVKPLVFGFNDYFQTNGMNNYIFNEKEFFNNYSDYIHGIYVDNFSQLFNHDIIHNHQKK